MITWLGNFISFRWNNEISFTRKLLFIVYLLKSNPKHLKKIPILFNKKTQIPVLFLSVLYPLHAVQIKIYNHWQIPNRESELSNFLSFIIVRFNYFQLIRCGYKKSLKKTDASIRIIFELQMIQNFHGKLKNGWNIYK